MTFKLSNLKFNTIKFIKNQNHPHRHLFQSFLNHFRSPYLLVLTVEDMDITLAKMAKMAKMARMAKMAKNDQCLEFYILTCTIAGHHGKTLGNMSTMTK